MLNEINCDVKGKKSDKAVLNVKKKKSTTTTTDFPNLKRFDYYCCYITF